MVVQYSDQKQPLRAAGNAGASPPVASTSALFTSTAGDQTGGLGTSQDGNGDKVMSKYRYVDSVLGAEQTPAVAGKSGDYTIDSRMLFPAEDDLPGSIQELRPLGGVTWDDPEVIALCQKDPKQWGDVAPLSCHSKSSAIAASPVAFRTRAKCQMRLRLRAMYEVGHRRRSKSECQDTMTGQHGQQHSQPLQSQHHPSDGRFQAYDDSRYRTGLAFRHEHSAQAGVPLGERLGPVQGRVKSFNEAPLVGLGAVTGSKQAVGTDAVQYDGTQPRSVPAPWREQPVVARLPACERLRPPTDTSQDSLSAYRAWTRKCEAFTRRVEALSGGFRGRHVPPVVHFTDGHTKYETTRDHNQSEGVCAGELRGTAGTGVQQDDATSRGHSGSDVPAPRPVLVGPLAQGVPSTTGGAGCRDLHPDARFSSSGNVGGFAGVEMKVAGRATAGLPSGTSESPLPSVAVGLDFRGPGNPAAPARDSQELDSDGVAQDRLIAQRRELVPGIRSPALQGHQYAASARVKPPVPRKWGQVPATHLYAENWFEIFEQYAKEYCVTDKDYLSSVSTYLERQALEFFLVEKTRLRASKDEKLSYESMKAAMMKHLCKPATQDQARFALDSFQLLTPQEPLESACCRCRCRVYLAYPEASERIIDQLVVNKMITVVPWKYREELESEHRLDMKPRTPAEFLSKVHAIQQGEEAKRRYKPDSRAVAIRPFTPVEGECAALVVYDAPEQVQVQEYPVETEQDEEAAIMLSESDIHQMNQMNQFGYSRSAPNHSRPAGQQQQQPQRPPQQQQQYQQGPPARVQPYNNTSMQSVQCFNCGRLGHFAKDCNKPPQQQQQTGPPQQMQAGPQNQQQPQQQLVAQTAQVQQPLQQQQQAQPVQTYYQRQPTRNARMPLVQRYAQNRQRQTTGEAYGWGNQGPDWEQKDYDPDKMPQGNLFYMMLSPSVVLKDSSDQEDKTGPELPPQITEKDGSATSNFGEYSPTSTKTDSESQMSTPDVQFPFSESKPSSPDDQASSSGTDSSARLHVEGESNSEIPGLIVSDHAQSAPDNHTVFDPQDLEAAKYNDQGPETEEKFIPTASAIQADGELQRHHHQELPVADFFHAAEAAERRQIKPEPSEEAVSNTTCKSPIEGGHQLLQPIYPLHLRVTTDALEQQLRALIPPCPPVLAAADTVVGRSEVPWAIPSILRSQPDSSSSARHMAAISATWLTDPTLQEKEHDEAARHLGAILRERPAAEGPEMQYWKKKVDEALQRVKMLYNRNDKYQLWEKKPGGGGNPVEAPPVLFQPAASITTSQLAPEADFTETGEQSSASETIIGSIQSSTDTGEESQRDGVTTASSSFKQPTPYEKDYYEANRRLAHMIKQQPSGPGEEYDQWLADCEARRQLVKELYDRNFKYNLWQPLPQALPRVHAASPAEGHDRSQSVLPAVIPVMPICCDEALQLGTYYAAKRINEQQNDEANEYIESIRPQTEEQWREAFEEDSEFNKAMKALADVIRDKPTPPGRRHFPPPRGELWPVCPIHNPTKIGRETIWIREGETARTEQQPETSQPQRPLPLMILEANPHGRKIPVSEVLRVAVATDEERGHQPPSVEQSVRRYLSLKKIPTMAEQIQYHREVQQNPELKTQDPVYNSIDEHEFFKIWQKLSHPPLLSCFAAVYAKRQEEDQQRREDSGGHPDPALQRPIRPQRLNQSVSSQTDPSASEREAVLQTVHHQVCGSLQQVEDTLQQQLDNISSALLHPEASTPARQEPVAVRHVPLPNTSPKKRYGLVPETPTQSTQSSNSSFHRIQPKRQRFHRRQRIQQAAPAHQNPPGTSVQGNATASRITGRARTERRWMFPEVEDAPLGDVIFVQGMAVVTMLDTGTTLAVVSKEFLDGLVAFGYMSRAMREYFTSPYERGLVNASGDQIPGCDKIITLPISTEQRGRNRLIHAVINPSPDFPFKLVLGAIGMSRLGYEVIRPGGQSILRPEFGARTPEALCPSVRLSNQLEEYRYHYIHHAFIIRKFYHDNDIIPHLAWLFGGEVPRNPEGEVRMTALQYRQMSRLADTNRFGPFLMRERAFSEADRWWNKTFRRELKEARAIATELQGKLAPAGTHMGTQHSFCVEKEGRCVAVLPGIRHINLHTRLPAHELIRPRVAFYPLPANSQLTPYYPPLSFSDYVSDLHYVTRSVPVQVDTPRDMSDEMYNSDFLSASGPSRQRRGLRKYNNNFCFMMKPGQKDATTITAESSAARGSQPSPALEQCSSVTVSVAESIVRARMAPDGVFWVEGDQHRLLKATSPFNTRPWSMQEAYRRASDFNAYAEIIVMNNGANGEMTVTKIKDNARELIEQEVEELLRTDPSQFKQDLNPPTPPTVFSKPAVLDEALLDPDNFYPGRYNRPSFDYLQSICIDHQQLPSVYYPEGLDLKGVPVFADVYDNLALSIKSWDEVRAIRKVMVEMTDFDMYVMDVFLAAQIEASVKEMADPPPQPRQIAFRNEQAEALIHRHIRQGMTMVLVERLLCLETKHFDRKQLLQEAWQPFPNRIAFLPCPPSENFSDWMRSEVLDPSVRRLEELIFNIFNEKGRPMELVEQVLNAAPEPILNRLDKDAELNDLVQPHLNVRWARPQAGDEETHGETEEGGEGSKEADDDQTADQLSTSQHQEPVTSELGESIAPDPAQAESEAMEASGDGQAEVTDRSFERSNTVFAPEVQKWITTDGEFYAGDWIYPAIMHEGPDTLHSEDPDVRLRSLIELKRHITTFLTTKELLLASAGNPSNVLLNKYANSLNQLGSFCIRYRVILADAPGDLRPVWNDVRMYMEDVASGARIQAAPVYDIRALIQKFEREEKSLTIPEERTQELLHIPPPERPFLADRRTMSEAQRTMMDLDEDMLQLQSAIPPPVTLLAQEKDALRLRTSHPDNPLQDPGFINRKRQVVQPGVEVDLSESIDRANYSQMDALVRRASDFNLKDYATKQFHARPLLKRFPTRGVKTVIQLFNFWPKLSPVAQVGAVCTPNMQAMFQTETTKIYEFQWNNETGHVDRRALSEREILLSSYPLEVSRVKVGVQLAQYPQQPMLMVLVTGRWHCDKVVYKMRRCGLDQGKKSYIFFDSEFQQVSYGQLKDNKHAENQSADEDQDWFKAMVDKEFHIIKHRYPDSVEGFDDDGIRKAATASVHMRVANRRFDLLRYFPYEISDTQFGYWRYITMCPREGIVYLFDVQALARFDFEKGRDALPPLLEQMMEDPNLHFVVFNKKSEMDAAYRSFGLNPKFFPLDTWLLKYYPKFKKDPKQRQDNFSFSKFLRWGYCGDIDKDVPILSELYAAPFSKFGNANHSRLRKEWGPRHPWTQAHGMGKRSLATMWCDGLPSGDALLYPCQGAAGMQYTCLLAVLSLDFAPGAFDGPENEVPRMIKMDVWRECSYPLLSKWYEHPINSQPGTLTIQKHADQMIDNMQKIPYVQQRQRLEDPAWDMRLDETADYQRGAVACATELQTIAQLSPEDIVSLMRQFHILVEHMYIRQYVPTSATEQEGAMQQDSIREAVASQTIPLPQQLAAWKEDGWLAMKKLAEEGRSTGARELLDRHQSCHLAAEAIESPVDDKLQPAILKRLKTRLAREIRKNQPAASGQPSAELSLLSPVVPRSHTKYNLLVDTLRSIGLSHDFWPNKHDIETMDLNQAVQLALSRKDTQDQQEAQHIQEAQTGLYVINMGFALSPALPGYAEVPMIAVPYQQLTDPERSAILHFKRPAGWTQYPPTDHPPVPDPAHPQSTLQFVSYTEEQKAEMRRLSEERKHQYFSEWIYAVYFYLTVEDIVRRIRGGEIIAPVHAPAGTVLVPTDGPAVIDLQRRMDVNKADIPTRAETGLSQFGYLWRVKRLQQLEEGKPVFPHAYGLTNEYIKMFLYGTIHKSQLTPMQPINFANPADMSEEEYAKAVDNARVTHARAVRRDPQPPPGPAYDQLMFEKWRERADKIDAGEEGNIKRFTPGLGLFQPTPTTAEKAFPPSGEKTKRPSRQHADTCKPQADGKAKRDHHDDDDDDQKRGKQRRRQPSSSKPPGHSSTAPPKSAVSAGSGASSGHGQRSNKASGGGKDTQEPAVTFAKPTRHNSGLTSTPKSDESESSEEDDSDGEFDDLFGDPPTPKLKKKPAAVKSRLAIPEAIKHKLEAFLDDGTSFRDEAARETWKKKVDFFMKQSVQPAIVRHEDKKLYEDALNTIEALYNGMDNEQKATQEEPPATTTTTEQEPAKQQPGFAFLSAPVVDLSSITSQSSKQFDASYNSSSTAGTKVHSVDSSLHEASGPQQQLPKTTQIREMAKLLTQFRAEVIDNVWILAIESNLDRIMHPTGHDFPKLFPLNDELIFRFREYCPLIPPIEILASAATTGEKIDIDLGDNDPSVRLLCRATVTKRSAFEPEELQSQMDLIAWWLLDADLSQMSFDIPVRNGVIQQDQYLSHLPHSRIIDFARIEECVDMTFSTAHPLELLDALIDFKVWPETTEAAVMGPFATPEPVPGYRRVLHHFGPFPDSPTTAPGFIIAMERTIETTPGEKEFVPLICFLPQDSPITFVDRATIYWAGYRACLQYLDGDELEMIAANLTTRQEHATAETLVNNALSAVIGKTVSVYDPDGHSPYSAQGSRTSSSAQSTFTASGSSGDSH